VAATARIRVDFPDRRSIGIGKVELLERIAGCGSLAQAARQMRMSYRRAWLLLEDINRTFDRPVARTSVGGRGGGGVQLTDFGMELVRSYRKLEADIQPLVFKYFEATSERVAKDVAAAPKRNSIKMRRTAPDKS
jgi:molybdate transport system regulatory protein